VLVAEGVKNGSGETITSPGDFGIIQASFGTAWNANAGVTLSQILFDGQVFVGLKARKTAIGRLRWKWRLGMVGHPKFAKFRGARK
jgi:hypothetical protein